MQVRRSSERGHANHGWLDSYHTFSFANYYDPEHMGFGVLRVINEDRIAGGAGFPMHPHKDMEILTYVISGALAHKDSMGNSAVILPGEVQRMSAGTGVRHSEFNSLKDQETHLLQIWMLPDQANYQPGYEQKSYTDSLAKKPLVLVLSRDGKEGTVRHNQDVELYASYFQKSFVETFYIRPLRSVWLQMIAGELTLTKKDKKETLLAGDAIAATGDGGLKIEASQDAHFLLFDLPPTQ